jgi:hypothetical protein
MLTNFGRQILEMCVAFFMSGYVGRLRCAAVGMMAISAVMFAVTATAATIDVNDNHGGRVKAYDARWAAAAARGDSVRIVGPCQSACTVLLGHIPRARICVTPNASFGFHLAKTLEATTTLRNAYASDIKGWIQAHGGLTDTFTWMRAPDTYRYFKKC